MSEYWLYDKNPFCVNAKSPIAHATPNEAFFNMKSGIVWNQDLQKWDVGYSNILRKHGQISMEGSTIGGEEISYLLIDSTNIFRLNFNDQQILGAASLRLRAGEGYDTESSAALDVTMAWDGANTYEATSPDAWEFLRGLAGAVVPVRITVT